MLLTSVLPAARVRDLAGLLEQVAGALLQHVLRDLTADQRAAVLLMGYVGLTSEEAGQMLGMRPSTVRTLATRARAAIRQRTGETQ